MNTTTDLAAGNGTVGEDLDKLIADTEASLSAASEEEVLPLIELLQALITQRQLIRDVAIVQNSQLFVNLGQKVDALSADMNRDLIGGLLRRTRALIDVASGEEISTERVEGSFAGDIQALASALTGAWTDLLDQVPAVMEHAEPDKIIPLVTAAQPVSASGSKRKVAQAIRRAASRVGVNASLLGAIGWIESKLVNGRARADQGHAAEGVFQFMPRMWEAYVARAGDVLGVSKGDNRKVDAQALIAAAALSSYRMALSKLRGGTEPTPGSLYLGHLLGVPAAGAVLKAETGQRIDQVLQKFYENTPLGSGFARRIIAANPLLTGDGVPLAVGTVRERTEAMVSRAMAIFDGHLDRADLPTVEFPPWYEVAERERALGVAEISGSENNPRILQYLATTTIWSDLAARKDETHWCAAFVNWCLKEAGVKGTALANARSFLDWRDGRRLERPTLGCVVVMWRNSPDSAEGHIGFYAGDGSETAFEMLSGNQGNRVSIKEQPRNQVLGYFWPKGFSMPTTPL